MRRCSTPSRASMSAFRCRQLEQMSRGLGRVCATKRSAFVQQCPPSPVMDLHQQLASCRWSLPASQLRCTGSGRGKAWALPPGSALVPRSFSKQCRVQAAFQQYPVRRKAVCGTPQLIPACGVQGHAGSACTRGGTDCAGTHEQRGVCRHRQIPALPGLPHTHKSSHASIADLHAGCKV